MSPADGAEAIAGVPAQAAHTQPAQTHRARQGQAHLRDAHLFPLQQVRSL